MSENTTPETETGDTDRLFVPLNSEPWHAFERGEKRAEFRGVNNQFNPETVREGRRVELRRGYSTDDSLWGTIEEVTVDDSLGDLVLQYLDELQYGGKSRGEVAYSANELVGDYGEYIVFTVRLDTETDRSKADE
jgi:hypothetical protein